jgi:ABC-type multidrug transport system ATPase subunit
MQIIATIQDADSGAVWLDGVNVLEQKEEVRELIGYLPQEFRLYPNVFAIELLDHLAMLKGIVNKKERALLVEEILVRTNLFEVRKKKLSIFSEGMKLRFGIAQALIGNPKLIIVDEPIDGLDLVERNNFLNLLREIGENTIVIISTHNKNDVKEYCSQMAIIDSGQVKIEEYRDIVLEKTIGNDEFNQQSGKNNFISNKLNSGDIEDYLNNGFELSATELEDAYFDTIKELV